MKVNRCGSNCCWSANNKLFNTGYLWFLQRNFICSPVVYADDVWH